MTDDTKEAPVAVIPARTDAMRTYTLGGNVNLQVIERTIENATTWEFRLITGNDNPAKFIASFDAAQAKTLAAAINIEGGE